MDIPRFKHISAEAQLKGVFKKLNEWIQVKIPELSGKINILTNAYNLLVLPLTFEMSKVN